MTNLKLKVDKEKCINCGMCIKDCMSSVLKFDGEGVPQVAEGGEQRCIGCQHCMAICPTGALSIFDKNPDNSERTAFVDENALLTHIKSRRSTRYYKKENVPAETMEKLKNMLDFVPTGCNAHSLHFTFIDDIAAMDDYREFVLTRLKNRVKFIPSLFFKKFAKYKKKLMNGEDIVFRGAPHMVVVSIPDNAPCKDINPIIALSYFELYAQSLGVATCWCELGQMCLQSFPKAVKKLNIPNDCKPHYVMLFGLPEVKYARTIQPEPYNKNSVK